MSRTLPDRIVQTQARTALALLEQVQQEVASGTPADAVLQQHYRRHAEYGSRDRRLYSSLIYSWFRWKGWLDLASNAPLALKAAVAYRLDMPEAHPALPLDDAAGPLGTLGEKAEQAARWLGLPSTPTPESLLPKAVLPLLAVPPSPFTQTSLAEAFQNRPPTWIRLRPGGEGNFSALCASLNVSPIAHPRLAGAWQIPDTARLADLIARAQGLIDIQDIASQAVAQVASPQSGSSWWDVCAGSCGKTLHLADLARGRIKILATDRRESSLEEGKRRLAKAGHGHAITFQPLDAARDNAPGGPFDGVLVDAPCSGTGTWGRNPDARWRWKADDLPDLTALQSALLDKASAAVKPDGALVYATCSLTVPENTGVVDAFLKTHPDFSPAPFVHPLTGAPCPGQGYLWPWEGPGSGFFIARFTRKSGA